MLIIAKYNTKNRNFSCRCCVGAGHRIYGKIYRNKYTREMKYIDYVLVNWRY